MKVLNKREGERGETEKGGGGGGGGAQIDSHTQRHTVYNKGLR